MSLTALDWTIIGSFLLLSLYIGLKFRGQASGSLADFFLGGRNLPWYIAGISMVATTFAADTPLAVTELIGSNGISGNWLWWNLLAGGMLTTFFFARLWRRAGILTEPELIELRYSGKPAALLRGFKAVYLGFFMNVVIIGWVNLAMISIIQVFFDTTFETAILYTGGVMVVAMIYSSLSGLLGVAITDTIQFFIAIIACIILAVIVVNSDVIGGISGLKEVVPASAFDFFPRTGSVAEQASNGIQTLGLTLGAFLAFIGIPWWASWYPGAEPGGGGYIAQRMMSARTEKDSLFATLFFQIAHYCIRPWPWIIVGLCAVYLYSFERASYPPELLEQVVHLQSEGFTSDEVLNKLPQLTSYFEANPVNEQVFEYQFNKRLGFVFIMKDFLPAGLTGLLLVAFLAAYMSTISTQLNWGASYLINDLYKRYIKPEEKITGWSKDNTIDLGESNERIAQKHYVAAGRVVTVLIMITGLFATFFITSISGVWEFIIECGAGLGLVLILRWYWWRINAWSEITATIAPFLAYAFSTLYLEPEFGAVFIENKGTLYFTVTFTTISWLVVTFVTSPTPVVKLREFYSRVTPEGWWGPVSDDPNRSGSKRRLGYLAICWLSAIIMTYSILFLTGKIILMEWEEAIIWLATGVAGLIGMVYFLKRSEG